MKNFYKVSNTIENGPRMDRKRTVVGPMKDRVKSRISPINHRLWTVIAPMLLVAFGLFGVNENAWGAKKTDGTITIIAGKGSVSIGAYFKPNAWTTKDATGSISTIENESNIGKPKNVARNDRGNTDDGWLVFTATPATGYTFYGWCTSPDCSDASPDKTISKQYNEDRSWGLHHDLTVVRYTKFVPITYNIAYNGNGSTSGTMAKTEVTYDSNATLRTNTFKKKKCTVSFEANGGTGAPASLDVNYPFLGWATSDNGNVVYTNGQTLVAPDANLRTSAGDYDLYAKWGSTTTAITLPTVTKSDFSFAGWYSDSGLTNKVNNAGEEYNPDSNVTLYAKWTKEAAEPSFAGTGFVNGNKGMKVGDGYTSFTFTNTSTPVPSASTSANFYYVISNTNVTTDNTTGSPDGNKVIGVEYDGNTTIIRALNQGTADITFYQQADATNNIAEGNSVTYTFTVTKNDPVFTWTPQTYYFNKTYANIFSSNNHDTEISCSTTNSGAAEMVDGSNSYQKTLKTYNDASATITISQAENYYWEPKTVNNYAVSNSKASNHVAFTINNSAVRESLYKGKSSNGTISCSDDGLLQLTQGGPAWTANALYYTIELSGIPDKISFIYRQTMSIATAIGPTGKAFVIYESPTGADNTWNEVWSSNGVKGDDDNHDVDPQSLSASTRFIKFYFDATYTGQYKNITVTELQYFRRQGENTTLDFATNVKNQEPAVQSFVVEHANAGYQTSVTAPEHYLVSKDNVNFASEVVYSTNETAVTGGDKMGTFTVYVKYLADAIGTHNANVTVHNNLRTDFNVPVTGTTKDKIATQIEYCGASSYSVDAANIASTTLFRVRDTDNDTIVNISGVGISLSCAENDQFSIVGGNALDPECGGTNNVKPSFAGNDTYAAATNNNANFAITITRRADEINFDNARSTLVVGDEIDLSDWASAESESEITYEVMSSDQLTGSIKIENGKLIALSAGTVRIKATSEGNCLYNSGYDFHNMKVRNPGDPCGSLLLDKSATVKCGVTAKTSESPQEYAISAGPMDELKFKIWRVATAGDQVTIRFVDKDGNAVPNGTYTYSAGSLGTSKPDSYTVIDVSNITGATKLQIYGGGLLNKYVSNVQITQKAYLTTYVGSTQLEPTANVTMPEVKACNTSTKDITIKYSDLTPIQLSHTNDVFTYEIYKGENKVGFFDNDCRGFGTYTVRCICTPTSKGEYSDVLTLTASGQSQTINLSLNATAPDRTIVWDIPTGNTITATQSLDLTAYAETSCQSPAGSVYYTASPADAVTIDPIDGNHITFNKAATVTVTAHTVTSEDYNDAPTVDKVWTVSKVGVQMTKLPTITSPITYGDNSSVVTHNNTFTAVSVLDNTHEVAGSIAYVSPTNFTAAGETNLIFTFTPTIEWDVYEPIQFTVPVTVQKAEATLSWTANPASVVYGNVATYTASSISDGAITYSIKEGSECASIDANTGVLTVNEAGHTVVVQATQEAGTNYVTPQAITAEVTLNKAEATLSWATAPESVEYGATGVVYEASSASNGAITYSIIAGDDCASIDSESGALTITKAGSFTVQASQAAGTNHNAPETITKEVTVNKITPILTWTVAPTELAFNATGVTYEASSVSDGVISYSIVSVNDYAEINAETGVLTILVPGQTVTVQAVQTEGTNYLAPEAITINVTIGAAPLSNVFTNDAGDGDWDNANNWESGIVPTSDPDIIVTGALEINDSITVGSLTIEQTGSVAVISGGTLTVKGTSDYRSEYGDVHVLNDGELALGNSADLQVRNFKLDAKLGDGDTKAASGQVKGDDKLNVNGDAYFQLSFDPAGAISYGWYDFTVPFPVNISGGIERINSTSDKVMVCGQDFLLMEDDEVSFVNGGKGWRQISSGVLEPGKLYTITFDDEVNQNTFRFAWNGQGSITNGDTFAAQCLTGSDASRNGWNALGNAMLQHGYVDGSYKLQAYDHTYNVYEIVYDPKTFAVGTAFFVQVLAAGDIDWTAAEATPGRPLYAPQREAKDIDEFRLSLRSESNDAVNDVLFFSASEEAIETYMIGHDLLKKGTPTEAKKAQMWAIKDGKNLCDVEAMLVNDEATTPLNLYAPNAGQYTLAVEEMPEDATLYLTYNGNVIWDLTASPYVFDLTKGTTTGYALRIVAANAPQITTGVDDVQGGEAQVRKVIIDNKMYIITPEGAIFDAIGKKVQ